MKTLCPWEQINANHFQQRLLLLIPWHESVRSGKRSWKSIHGKLSHGGKAQLGTPANCLNLPRLVSADVMMLLLSVGFCLLSYMEAYLRGLYLKANQFLLDVWWYLSSVMSSFTCLTSGNTLLCPSISTTLAGCLKGAPPVNFCWIFWASDLMMLCYTLSLCLSHPTLCLAIYSFTLPCYILKKLNCSKLKVWLLRSFSTF